MSSSKHFFLALAIAAIVFPTVSFATDHVVGDDAGWTTGFDYASWAKGKEFMVGDRLIFKYNVGAHNVFKVNGTVFKSCEIPPLSEALVTGNDVIPLATPGNKWYICGVAQHCAQAGQKLSITVLASAYSPAPSPNSAAEIITSGFQILTAAVTSVAMIFLV